MIRALSFRTHAYAVGLAFGVVAPAFAQERLIVMRDTGQLVELDTSDARLGAVRRAAQFPRFTGATQLAGGRFLLLHRQAEPTFPAVSRPTATALFDTHPFAPVALGPVFPGAVSFEADDFKPRVFYRSETEIGVLEGPGFAKRVLRASPDIERSDLFCCGPLEYEASTDTLFTMRRTATGVEIIALDAAAGNLRGTITPNGTPGALIASHSRGTIRVVVGVPIAVFQEHTQLIEYDAATLAPVAQSLVYPVVNGAALFGGLTWSADAARRQLLAGSFGGLVAFAVGDDLLPRAAVSFGYLGLNPPVANSDVRPLASTVRNRAFSFVSRYDYTSSTAPLSPGKSFLVAMDANTLAPVMTVDLIRNSGFTAGGGSALLLSPPPPPASLTAAVAGAHVDLQWRDPGDATHFVVEIGSVPGRSNLGILHTSSPRFIADGIPPGRYYVRVRAMNDVGMSLTSNEVVVTVTAAAAARPR